MSSSDRPTVGSSNSDWSELTQECLLNILSRLTLEDRWRGAIFACKPWSQACKDPSLNTVFDLEPFFVLSPELTHWWSPEFRRRIDGMVRCVIERSEGLLTEIRVRHCSDQALMLVAGRCPKLQILSVKSSQSVTDSAMAEIACKCSMLSEVDVSYCYEISHKSISSIGRHCPSLKILRRNLMNCLYPSQHIGIVPNEYLNSCPQDGDSEAAAIATTMPNIEHLELQFSKLTGKGLVLISERCLKLEYLDLTGCANLTSRDIVNASSNLKNLKTVKEPNFFIPRSVFQTERYGHWRLYDERFQTDIFRI